MIDYFTRHPTAANLLMLGIILLGVMGALSLTRAVFPEFESDFVQVSVVYKGASAEEVEETICERIEEELEGIEGVEEVTSVAQEGIGHVTVEVADGFERLDVYTDVDNAVNQINNFPQQAETPLVWQQKRYDQVITLSLSGEMPPRDLLALGEQIKDDLLRLENISLVDVSGFSEHQIQIELKQDALLSLGLSVSDVTNALAAHSLDLPVGSIETESYEYKIRVVDQRKWAEDFRDLPVVSRVTGGDVPLRAIARITDTFENEWDQITFDGVRCVNLTVKAVEGEDVINAARQVRAFISERQAELPAGVDLTLWNDMSVIVQDRLGMLIKNGLQGFLLVFLTLWLMLSLRLSFWVTLGIPISFLGTLFVLEMCGMTLNMITMFSLILALGLIVDDAIVIGENIYSHRMRGKGAVQAAVDGTREVAVAVTASMLTTIAVFMPLLMMTGQMGKVLRVMPVGVIIALGVSLIEGFLILPNHLGHALACDSRSNRIRRRIDRGVEWFTERVYGRVLTWCVTNRSVPIAAVATLLLLAVGQLAGGRIQFTPFPELDGDTLVARVLMPAGIDLEHTRSVVRKVEQALEEVNREFKPSQPGENDLILAVCTSYGVNDTAGESGSHVATTFVQLLTADNRNARCDDIVAAWREAVGEIPNTVSVTFDQMEVGPAGKAIDIQFRGRDLGALKTASLQLQEKLQSFPGVNNVMDNLRPGKHEAHVRVKPSARALGLTAQILAMQLRDAFWGGIAQEFQRDGDTFDLRVRLHSDDRGSLSDLDDFKIFTPAGDQVPFHDVATVEYVRGYARIERAGGQRLVSVSADVETRVANAAEVLADLERVDPQTGRSYFDTLLDEHPGVWLNFEGQRKETAKTTSSVGQGFAIGLAIVFILLSFIFKSYIQPIVVMTAIPFGLIGAIFGHKLMGLDWTMPSTVGFVSLSGIVVNDSIVLVQFIKSRLAEGVELRKAVIEAGKARFRPVFLTSATTVAGLLPILLESSLQAQILIPVASSIAFGLMFATTLVLLLVPCLFSLLPCGKTG